MKQVIQIHHSSFNLAISKILGIEHPSFVNEEDVLETIKNCIVKLKVGNVLKVSELSFLDGNMGDKTFAYFTFYKLDSVTDDAFLNALALFKF